MLQTYFLGGYTKRINEGITKVTFDSETATFGDITPIDQLTNPTWLTFNQDKTFFIAIDKNETHGGIALYQKKNGEFLKLTSCYATTAAGCHITINEQDRVVYVSNYHEGSIDLYRLHDDFQLSFIKQFKHSGSSVHPNQQSPHVHMTQMNIEQNKLYVCDLGIDQILVYSIINDGLLHLDSIAQVPDGTGPRHLIFHPTLNKVYLVGELKNTTSVLTVNDDGSLTYTAEYPNTPVEHQDTSAGAAIRMSKDGNYLYTSTRFRNIITVFKIAADGLLEEIQQICTNGEIPRDFILDATENFLLVPHQDSDNITVLNRDLKTGKLSLNPSEKIAPECVNIVYYDSIPASI